MARFLNINLCMDIYNQLINNACHKTAAETLNVSKTHVGRIANFLVEECFIVPVSLKMHTKLYTETKRVPSPKILYEIYKSRKSNDGGSSLCGIHKLQYRSELKSNISQEVIKWCRQITPKGSKKYLFPPNKNLKLGFSIIIHDGLKRKSVMFYLKRIHLTYDELPISDEITKERLQRIAYNIMHLFKIKLGVPKPVGKNREYAIVPKEKFLIDALEEMTFEINSPVGTIKGDASGDAHILNGKEIEFDKKNLVMTYVKMIPTIHMTGEIAVSNKESIEGLEDEVSNIKAMILDFKPMLEKFLNYIDVEQKKNEFFESENHERGMFN